MEGGSFDRNYGGQLNMAKQARQATHRQRLEQSIRDAEERIAKLKEARELLDRNPDLERLLDIMQQSHF
jgi:bacterioferritin (cytochrome b1)